MSTARCAPEYASGRLDSEDANKYEDVGPRPHVIAPTECAFLEYPFRLGAISNTLFESVSPSVEYVYKRLYKFESESVIFSSYHCYDLPIPASNS